MLNNPIYAGAYAFGRTGSRTSIVDERAHNTRGHHKPRSEWKVLIQDHHPGYITWEEYERNQKILADNANMKGRMARGRERAFSRRTKSSRRSIESGTSTRFIPS